MEENKKGKLPIINNGNLARNAQITAIALRLLYFLTRHIESNWLPRDAVLSLGLNSVVLLKQDGGFKVHAVQTGVIAGNEIQILSDLTTQDSVASNAQFLIDSESFIKTN